jgi:hypothetical protein
MSYGRSRDKESARLHAEVVLAVPADAVSGGELRRVR